MTALDALLEKNANESLDGDDAKELDLSLSRVDQLNRPFPEPWFVTTELGKLCLCFSSVSLFSFCVSVFLPCLGFSAGELMETPLLQFSCHFAVCLKSFCFPCPIG